MREPKLSDLRIDEKVTKKIRDKMEKAKKIKITINLDNDLLSAVKVQAEDSGIPYQILINRLIRKAIIGQMEELNRIAKIEDEIRDLRRIVG